MNDRSQDPMFDFSKVEIPYRSYTDELKPAKELPVTGIFIEVVDWMPKFMADLKDYINNQKSY